MQMKMNKDGHLSISDFSALQAYKIAVHMEKSGIQFYRDLLAKIQDAGTRTELDYLIGQELKHLSTFEELLAKTREAVEDGFEEDDLVDYMAIPIFDAHVPSQTVSDIQHRQTALEEALLLERRAIVFYEKFAQESSDPQAKAAFSGIVEEEKKHLSMFADLLRLKCLNEKKGCIF